MYLIFDTETTGLPQNWKVPLTDFNSSNVLRCKRCNAYVNPHFKWFQDG